MRQKYIIKFPDQLVPGDIVLSPKYRHFVKVSFVDNGIGAGHFDFGEYVIVTGWPKSISPLTKEEQISFWSFRDEPLVVIDLN